MIPEAEIICQLDRIEQMLSRLEIGQPSQQEVGELSASERQEIILKANRPQDHQGGIARNDELSNILQVGAVFCSHISSQT